jgi:hypothetical protein
MIVIYILLIGAGILPLAVFLSSRKRYRRILSQGTRISAQVTDVHTIYVKGHAYDRVTFAYLPPGLGAWKSGMYKFKIGTYRRGDQFDIFYLRESPDQYAIPGTRRYENPFLIFLVLFFLFTIYACFKIREAIGDSEIYFRS